MRGQDSQDSGMPSTTPRLIPVGYWLPAQLGAPDGSRTHQKQICSLPASRLRSGAKTLPIGVEPILHPLGRVRRTPSVNRGDICRLRGLAEEKAVPALVSPNCLSSMRMPTLPQTAFLVPSVGFEPTNTRV